MTEPLKATKFCPTCNDGKGAYIAIDKFWRNRARYDNLQAHCISCMKNYDKKNPEQRTARIERWKRKNTPHRHFNTDDAKNVVKSFVAGEKSAFVREKEDAALADFLAGED